MTLTRFEQRWFLALMEGYAPADGPGLAPKAGQVDYLDCIDRMLRASTGKSRFGLRLGIWLAAWAPFWMTGRLKTMASIDVAARSEILRRMLAHPALLVRGMATLLKMASTMAMLRVPELRARSNYDRREVTLEAGRRALPVVVSPVVASVQEAS